MFATPYQTNALTLAMAGIQDRARLSVALTIRRGARELLRDPWRFDRLRLSGYSPAEALAHCERRIAGMVALGRAGSWTYDSNALLGLRQARLALRYLRRFGDRLAAQEAAE